MFHSSPVELINIKQPFASLLTARPIFVCLFLCGWLIHVMELNMVAIVFVFNQKTSFFKLIKTAAVIVYNHCHVNL